MLDEGQDFAVKARVMLHLGAHKTASTHFNRVVRRNSHLLRDHSVSAPKKDEIRTLLTRFLGVEGDVAHLHELVEMKEAKKTSLPLLLDEQQSLFLSDENILGTPNRLFARDMMYPNAHRRLKNAMGFFAQGDVTIMLAVRSQAEFITSSYCEAIRSHGFIEFPDFLNGMQIKDMRWTKLVRRLMKVTADAPFLLWSYESYRDSLPHLLQLTLGCEEQDDFAFRDIKNVVRPGMSQRALDEIKRLSVSGDEAQAGTTIEDIMSHFPKSEEFPAPQLWNDDDRAALNKNYRQDLKQLAEFERVTFLG